MDRSLPEPADAESVRYSFAGFRLEADGTLLRGETPVDLPAQELALLRLLLARARQRDRASQVVSLRELSHALHGEAHAPRDRLSKCIASLRAHLQPADCIESVYKRGYRISAAVNCEGGHLQGALPRLAILPFAAGLGVPEYLGVGVAETAMEILAGGGHPVASILARDSIFTLARRGLSAQELGKALQADLVLTGGLHAAPGRHRLRAEMFRVDDGAPLWVEDILAERAGIEDGNIAALADELVRCVTFRLRDTSGLHSGGGGLSISAAAAASAEAAPETAPVAAPSQVQGEQGEARDLYLRAHYEWQTLERHRMQDAMGRLTRAIEIDPSLLAARLDLAHLSIMQALCGFMSPRASAALVHRACERIPDLNQESGAGAVALLPAVAWIDFHCDCDLPSALRAWARCGHLFRNPAHDPWATRVRSLFLLSRHRFAESIALLRAALLLDPYSPWLNAGLAWALHLAAEAAASVAQIDRAIGLFPEDDGGNFFAVMVLAYNGQAARAVDLAQALTARSPHFDLAIAAHAYALACAGRAGEARNLLERLQWLSRERFVLNTFNAATHVALGEPDAALAELRAACENRCPWFFQTLADPRLKPLHSRTEFQDLRGILAKMEAESAR